MASIFGPVHSRRFGISLGIDLSPAFKQCNFDCLYCELAPAATMAHQQQSIPVKSVMNELQKALQQHQNIDVITVTANGEPTLYPYLNALVDAIKALHVSASLLILTNSATLNDPQTFNTLLKFDQVKLSLDAISPEVFKKIDRPYSGIDIDEIILHVKRFSETFKGKLFIEILFVKAINDTPQEIAKLNETLLHVTCDRIDIGTIDRPSAYNVEALDYNALLQCAMLFDAVLPIHISSRHTQNTPPSFYSAADIINTLDKRPLSQDDISILFDTASRQTLKQLIQQGDIVTLKRSGIVFYLPAQNLKRKRQKS